VRLSSVKTAVPWICLFLFVLLPLYSISTIFALRTGVFDLQDSTINSDEYKAIWAFIASGFATAVTLIGLLLSRSHNKRATDQLALDTAVRSLELLVETNEKEASPAKVAGALAALVHLGHPVIAMRVLDSAWDEGAVNAGTACWLISEVFERGSEPSRYEASVLLLSHANNLCEDERRKGQYHWPNALDGWPKKLGLGYAIRYNNFLSLIDALLSRDREWWGTELQWMLAMMYRIVQTDRKFAADAARIVQVLVPVVEERFKGIDENPHITTWSWGGPTSLRHIKSKADLASRNDFRLIDVAPRLERLRVWSAKQD
jgi:hypothetical protein